METLKTLNESIAYCWAAPPPVHWTPSPRAGRCCGMMSCGRETEGTVGDDLGREKVRDWRSCECDQSRGQHTAFFL